MEMIRNILGCLFVTYLLAIPAHATPIFQSGELVGANNIVVEGALYNVSFGDGSCIDLFQGCDSDADFTFQSSDEALRASQALIDQVFIDGPVGDFDSEPVLMRGCDWFVACTILTPYELRPPSPVGDFLGAVVATNWWAGSSSTDDTAYTNASTDDVLATNARTYAVWTVSEIPAPPTFLLLGTLLLIMSFIRRKMPMFF